LLPLKDEDLFDRRVNSICKEYKFSTALSREDIPPPAAGWKCDTAFPESSKGSYQKVPMIRTAGNDRAVSQGSEDVLVKKNENYKGFQGWKQTICQINHFKKLFIGSNSHCYSPFCEQHSSQGFLRVASREMWSLLSCHCNTSSARAFDAF